MWQNKWKFVHVWLLSYSLLFHLFYVNLWAKSIFKIIYGRSLNQIFRIECRNLENNFSLIWDANAYQLQMVIHSCFSDREFQCFKLQQKMLCMTRFKRLSIRYYFVFLFLLSFCSYFCLLNRKLYYDIGSCWKSHVVQQCKQRYLWRFSSLRTGNWVMLLLLFFSCRCRCREKNLFFLSSSFSSSFFLRNRFTAFLLLFTSVQLKHFATHSISVLVLMLGKIY